MITFLHGLGPAFSVVEKILNKNGIEVQTLDHKIQVRGQAMPSMRLFRASDNFTYPIQHFDAKQQVSHQVLWDWCERFKLDAGKTFKIYRL